MIIDSETKRKLREMNAAELLDAFERLDERTVMPLNHAEVVGLAVDNAYGGYPPSGPWWLASSMASPPTPL